jgi:hypothetical protein
MRSSSSGVFGVLALACGLVSCVPSYSLSADQDSSAPTDAGGDAVGDAVASGSRDASDAAADGPAREAAPDLGIRCNTRNTFCTAVAQACCVVFAQVPDYCIDTGSPAACASDAGVTVIVECDDNADCASNPGTVCCILNATSSGTYTAVKCVSAGSCTKPNNLVACDPTVPDTCGVGHLCTLALYDPYATCN